MSVFKPFITSDVVVSPFKVNKNFYFEGIAALTGSGIDLFLGENTDPLLWVSGSTSTGYNSIQDQFLVYRSIRELYYYNYIDGVDGSSVATASFNPDGTITGLLYTPNSYNYLSNTLPANRYFPTGSGEIIGVIAIPSNLFGEYIKPGTFTLSYESGSFTDDGEGNILTGSSKVGDIIYEHGMVIITHGETLEILSLLPPLPEPPQFRTPRESISIKTPNAPIPQLMGMSPITSPNLTCSFDSTITIYESQYKCTLRENEFNFSQNPTLISGSTNSGKIYDYATGSYFNPYVTTVGLYNNDKELLAVAKLAQPLPLSSVTDMNILINLDL
jgi:hypothetical protein